MKNKANPRHVEEADAKLDLICETLGIDHDKAEYSDIEQAVKDLFRTSREGIIYNQDRYTYDRII